MKKRLFTFLAIIFCLSFILVGCSNQEPTPEPVYEITTYKVRYFKTDFNGVYYMDKEEEFAARVGTTVTIDTNLEGFAYSYGTKTKKIEANGATMFDLYFTRKSYVIKVIDEYNGESHVPHLYEKTISLKTPSVDGKNFLGYFLDSEGKQPFTLEKMPAHEIVLYALYD